MDLKNSYEDATRAEAYAGLGFDNTYHLAFRDLPAIFREHVNGTRALDFGCGTGRSTRFLAAQGFTAVGVDIAPEMIAKARATDPAGDYRLVPADDLSGFADGAFDLILCAFPFDNIPGYDPKVEILRSLKRLLAPRGRIVNIVSSPDMYTNEWASFSTRDFPANLAARPGDIVRIVTTDFGDRRPCEDILWPDRSYRAVYANAALRLLATLRPLAKGDEPYRWVSETTVAPWVIYVLAR